MTSARIVLTTVGSEEEARKIANALVEWKFAACVNIIPRIESVYRWQGKVERAQEILLLVKTTQDKFHEIQKAIKTLHSYELPECVMLSIEDGSEKYLNWIQEETR